MAISFQQGMANGAANAGPLTVTFDATPASGDLILFYYACGSVSDKAMPSISGYTLRDELYANGTVDTNSALYWKYSDGTETNVVGPDMAGTADGVSGVAMIFRGVASAAQGGPFSATPTTATGTTNGNADNAQIATAAGDAIVLCAAAAAGTIGTFTAPANYTTNAELGVAGIDTNDVKAAMAYRLSGYANPENPAAWAMSGTSNSYTAVTVALKEAPSATDLVIGEANVAVHSDNISLAPVLAIGEANIAVHADNVVLAPHLVIGESNITVHADNVVLTFPGTDLVIQDSNIAVHSDNVVLAPHLIPGESNIGVHADNVVLAPHLVIGESNIGVNSDNVVLSASPPSGVYNIEPTGTLLLTDQWQSCSLSVYSWDNSAAILSRISGRVKVRKTTTSTLRGRIDVEVYVDGVLVLEGSVQWPHVGEKVPYTYPVSGWMDLQRVGVDADLWYAEDGDHTFSVQARMTHYYPGVYLDIELLGQSLEVA